MCTQNREPKLTIDQFKIPDYQMTKEMKTRIHDLKKKYNKVDDAFLALFEKRAIIFVEDGTDLKEECMCFPDSASGQPLEAKDGMGIEATREAGDGDQGGLAVGPGVTTTNGGWRAQRLAGSLAGAMPPKSGYSTVR